MKKEHIYIGLGVVAVAGFLYWYHSKSKVVIATKTPAIIPTTPATAVASKTTTTGVDGKEESSDNICKVCGKKDCKEHDSKDEKGHHNKDGKGGKGHHRHHGKGHYDSKVDNNSEVDLSNSAFIDESLLNAVGSRDGARHQGGIIYKSAFTNESLLNAAGGVVKIPKKVLTPQYVKNMVDVLTSLNNVAGGSGIVPSAGHAIIATNINAIRASLPKFSNPTPAYITNIIDIEESLNNMPTGSGILASITEALAHNTITSKINSTIKSLPSSAPSYVGNILNVLALLNNALSGSGVVASAGHAIIATNINSIKQLL